MGMDYAINYYPTNAMNPYTGYGRLEQGIAKGLSRMGVQLNHVPDPAAPTLIVGYADWLAAPHIAHTRRWILTQCESTKVSQRWVDLMNWHAEGVLVTNPALPDIFRKSGLTRPVYCVGHGIELTIPVQAAGWDGSSRFEWLTYSYGDMRKGAELAIMAFKQLFHGRADHHLTVKARDGEGTWLAGLEDEQISVEWGAQSEHDWMQLLARSHAFVFPSRAEGFGMPPREATLAGLPTIATEWLGLADVPMWGVPIKLKGMSPTCYSHEAANAVGSEWAEPDVGHLVEQMQWVHQNYADARAIAERGRWHIRENNSFEQMAAHIVSAIHGERIPF
jgi:glycosyltransferase involved in cell wall biosynthesis